MLYFNILSWKVLVHWIEPNAQFGRSVLAWLKSYIFFKFYRTPAFNPAASLITMCPCGCGKEDHSSDNGSTASTLASGTSFPLPSPPPSSYQPVSLPNSPDLSPLKDSYDGPLDMSKTSPVFRNPVPGSTETPPPSPPENDRDKFRCLYLLVDAAVGQLEELEREKLYKNWVITEISVCA